MKFVSPLVGTCLLLAASCAFADDQFDLLNGTEVEAGYFEEVVRIRSEKGSCTATLVGPRVVVTAAHCGEDGETMKFTQGGRSYSGTLTRSEGYTQKIGSHDVALILVSKAVENVEPATVGGEYEADTDVLLLGYGCSILDGFDKLTKKPKVKKPDGKLRMGYSRIIGRRETGFVAKKSSGAAGCYGDSGGPSFLEDDDGTRYLFGIHSSANIKDTTFDIRTDVKETQTFLAAFAKKHEVDICGINKNCARLKLKPKKK